MFRPDMRSDLELMRLHVEAEFTHDAAGRLVATNEPNGAPAPRFFLGHIGPGAVRRYRWDVGERLRAALEAASESAALDAAPSDVPLDTAPFERILAADAPVTRTSTGLLFRFPRALRPAPGARLLRDPADAALLEALLPAWIPDLRASQPLAALVVEGRAVAVCASVRVTREAHEAGVETAPALRGRGYAAAAVVTWAAAVRAAGAEPLYSTWWQNAASRALARKLGLPTVGRDLHVT